MSNWITCQFSAVDTLFFKEAREMDSSGIGELNSLFPPPINTLMGALRTAIGEKRGVDWQEYKTQKSNHKLAAEIGYGEDTGPLRFRGPWLVSNGERLYPVPANILHKPSTDAGCPSEFAVLQLGDPVHCDLGKAVRFAQLPAGCGGGYKPLTKTWVNQQTWQSLAKGCIPEGLGTQRAMLHRPTDLFDVEPRLGIARDNALGCVKEGLLYQTRHLRQKTALSLAFELDVCGLNNDALTGRSLLKLGGEGRMASLHTMSARPDHTPPKIPGNAKGLIVHLLTPAQLNASPFEPLPGFELMETPGLTTWRGSIHGIEMTLHSAVNDKALRIGGWDLAKHEPKAVHSLSPSGSCWYVACNNPQQAATTLHGQQLGEGPSHQRGVIATAPWLD